MAPLLKPSECSVLVLDSADEPNAQDPNAEVVSGRDRISWLSTMESRNSLR